MSSSEITPERNRPRKGYATGEELLTEISVAPDGRVFVFGASAAVLDACGFGLVFIETVGTGQSEVEVASIADTTGVVQAPDQI